MSLHSTKSPRHARVFEILRQTQMADDVVGGMQKLRNLPVQTEQIEAFQRNALKSLERSAGISAKPSGNNKFF